MILLQLGHFLASGHGLEYLHQYHLSGVLEYGDFQEALTEMFTVRVKRLVFPGLWCILDKRALLDCLSNFVLWQRSILGDTSGALLF